MIEGRFGEKGELFFELELVVADGNLLVEALLDTGFTEFLALNKQDVENLDWLYFDQEELLTAKGLFVFDIYIGKIILNGQEVEMPVFAGDDIQEILLGCQWLKRFKLVSDYQENVLTLG